MMSTVLTSRYSASSFTDSVGGSSTFPSAATGLLSAAWPAPGVNWVRTDASWSAVSTAMACRGACRCGRTGRVWAQVGAAAGQPARIQDQLAIDGGKALQFYARLDLATPDAGAQRFSACRCRPPGLLPLLPPPLAGKRQGGGPSFRRW